MGQRDFPCIKRPASFKERETFYDFKVIISLCLFSVSPRDHSTLAKTFSNLGVKEKLVL